MRYCRVCLALLALSVMVLATAARAEDQASADGQIAELERLVARYEASASAGKSDAAAEMQHLISLSKLASLYMKTGRIEETWPLGEKILVKSEKLFGSDHPNVVGQLEAVASFRALQGRYAEAEKLRKRAIAINERAFGGDSLDVAASLQGMAGLFRLQNRNDEALTFATRALEIADRKLSPGDAQRAVFLSQVADIHMSAKRYDMAEPLLKKTLGILESAKGADPAVAGMQTIQYLQSLGLCYQGQGRHAEAKQIIDLAIATSAKLFGPGHYMTGAMLATLAAQLMDQGQLDESERLLKQALPISEKHGKLGAMLANNYLGLGLVEFKRKNWRNAYALLQRASTIAVGLEQVAAAGKAPSGGNRATAHAETFLLNAVAAYRITEANPNDTAALRDEAFRLAQRAERSQVAGALAQMAARVSAGAGPLAKLVRERQDLANEWLQFDKRLEKALASVEAERNAADEKSMRQRMSENSARLEVIDAQIAKEFPDFAKLSDPDPLSIADVQRLLGPHEVLIFIASRLNQSLIWAIGRESVAWNLVPLGEVELMREISALRCGLDETAWQGEEADACARAIGLTWTNETFLPFDLDRAHDLYKALLGGFSDLTKGAHLIVATSGPLAAIPLHVLVTEPPGAPLPRDAAGYAGAAWLAKRNAISNLPSVASLKSLRTSAKASRATRPFCGIANPVLVGPDDRYAGLARAASANQTCKATHEKATAAAAVRGIANRRAIPPAQLQGGLAEVDVIRKQIPLPETAEEICAVARDFQAGESDIHLAGRATEAEIKRLNAGGELSKYRIVHFATHGALAGQVSSTSEAGLILTPPAAATAKDDGYLTTSEIAELKLDADWVILSACNTAGAGKAGAEALSGLARAFFYAQARAVLASHWAVESRATVMLITAAAAALQREPGIGRAEALRRAMESLIDKGAAGGAHPKFWAPFVLVGEGGGER